MVVVVVVEEVAVLELVCTVLYVYVVLLVVEEVAVVVLVGIVRYLYRSRCSISVRIEVMIDM